MNKEQIEIFIKQLIENAVDLKVYNDYSPLNSSYPYLVVDSSRITTNYFPRIDGEIEISIWDMNSNYATVNNVADKLQNFFNFSNYLNEEVIGTFYLNVRNNVEDTDKNLKRCIMQFDIELYFLKEV